MKRLAVALMFLTRLRVPGRWNIESADVGRSMALFPLAGAGIGALQCGLLAAVHRLSQFVGERLGRPYTFPAPVLAVMVVLAGIVVTGALHLDGLADMADGFGGGHSRDDVLRIMRDHAIGAYGGIALAMLLAFKITSTLVLIEHGGACAFLVATPALARASIVVLGFLLPYARAAQGGLGAILRHVGMVEVLVSSLTAAALCVWLGVWRGGAALAVTVAASWWNARICTRRIQGITGDTLGANVEVCEALILTAGAVLNS